MTTKDGIEIKIMTKVEIVWSIQVFFFKPAKIPSPIPSGTEKTTEMILIIIEVGKRSAIIANAVAPGSIEVDVPQSKNGESSVTVKMLRSQLTYCSSIGLS